MKRILVILLVANMSWLLQAQTDSNSPYWRAVSRYMKELNPAMHLTGSEFLMSRRGDTVGYIFHFEPEGFLILSGSCNVRPVYAYSITSDLDLPPKHKSFYFQTIIDDLTLRKDGSQYIPASVASRIRLEWTAFLNGTPPAGPFEQWPPEGTTSTEGWLETNWTQTFPYNSMCPMDLNTGSRSVAGCPATAMAQIVNYHRTLNQTRFSDSDDYYHSYGAGNQYWIDDDYLARDFPCFDTLNQWLDTLESVYAINGFVDNDMKAALTFSCGVAAHQVYTSSVSGTFGLEQAIMAFQRFGYTQSHLVLPDDTTLNTQVAENIKVALPSQLGLLVSTGSGGHNVVVDGYNTNEYFHFNFGWGGSANGWYTLPPLSAPYNLTIIEGVIVDIKSDIYTGNPEKKAIDSQIKLTTKPNQDVILVKGAIPGSVIHLFDRLGQRIVTEAIGGWQDVIQVPVLHPGIYFYSVIADGIQCQSGKFFWNK